LRKEIDIKIAKTPGVDFVISCITGTQNNNKRKKDEENPENKEAVIKKGVAYFVVVKQSNVEDEVRKVVSSAGFNATLCYICPRGIDRNAADRSLKKLKTVLKVSYNFYKI